MAFVKSLMTGLIQEVPVDHWALSDRAGFEVITLEDKLPEPEVKAEAEKPKK